MAGNMPERSAGPMRLDAFTRCSGLVWAIFLLSLRLRGRCLVALLLSIHILLRRGQVLIRPHRHLLPVLLRGIGVRSVVVGLFHGRVSAVFSHRLGFSRGGAVSSKCAAH